MQPQTIEIDPRAALVESQLIEKYLRQRCLYLAQRLLEAETIIAKFTKDETDGN